MERQLITSIDTLPEKVKIITTRKNVNRRYGQSESNDRIQNNIENAEENGKKDAVPKQIVSSVFGRYFSYVAEIMKTGFTLGANIFLATIINMSTQLHFRCF